MATNLPESPLNPPASFIVRSVGWFINYYIERCLKVEIEIRDPSQRSQINFLNSGRRPIVLHAIDWSIGKRQNRRSFDGAPCDQEILPGNSFEIGFFPKGVFRENVRKFSGGTDFHTLRFRVHFRSGRVRSFRPGQALIDCLVEPHEGALS